MTIEEARALIPPGWVECPQSDWARKACGIRINLGPVNGSCIYAIPAPKPEPRRVPVANDFWIEAEVGHKYATVGSELHRSMLGAQWRLDLAAREWVEVME